MSGDLTYESPRPGGELDASFSPRDKGTLEAEQKGWGERSEGAEGG
jgi:hypothetical protein